MKKKQTKKRMKRKSDTGRRGKMTQKRRQLEYENRMSKERIRKGERKRTRERQ